MSIRSVHSRRTVPTQRSANEFAGRLRRAPDHVDAFGGEHRVEGSGEFRAPVGEQEPQAGHAMVEVHQHVAGLLGEATTMVDADISTAPIAGLRLTPAQARFWSILRYD